MWKAVCSTGLWDLVVSEKQRVLIKILRFVKKLIFLQTYRSGHNENDSKSCYLCIKLNIIHTEAYRSGHNGLDSKSSNPLIGTVGSNPTASAKSLENKEFSRLYSFYLW